MVSFGELVADCSHLFYEKEGKHVWSQCRGRLSSWRIKQNTITLCLVFLLTARGAVVSGRISSPGGGGAFVFFFPTAFLSSGQMSLGRACRLIEMPFPPHTVRINVFFFVLVFLLICTAIKREHRRLF